MKRISIILLLLSTLSYSVSAFLTDNHIEPKYFSYADGARVDVEKHLAEMKKLILENRRASFSAMFRVNPQLAFPAAITPDEFFDYAQQDQVFRDNLQIQLISRQINLGNGRYSFVYKTRFCELVNGHPINQVYQRNAQISNKIDSPSGFAFDSL
ncbi:unnamed protein product [Caenorhabditis bovis]|uniref:Uncharacterized protein n=1 Tax=Caenorhabditis bovis TaxID=2654633 RepID=A0A8S1ER74_9PELO|nr:unnamed protein product [Caenorhabditis bovis]